MIRKFIFKIYFKSISCSQLSSDCMCVCVHLCACPRDCLQLSERVWMSECMCLCVCVFGCGCAGVWVGVGVRVSLCLPTLYGLPAILMELF